MTEIWKQFKSIEVSTLGNLRDAVTKKEVITLKKNAGYLRVHYKGICEYVHRLVAIAFIANLENLPQVNHKDENKLNNCVDNLEWCTPKYNCNYGTRNIRQSQKMQGRHLSDTHKQSIANSLSGRERTDDVKDAISKGQSLRWSTRSDAERSAIASKGWETRRQKNA